ncbi:MAG: MobA/MobL family protein [Alphaproteobacteria bacterium]|nr:MobA/MobL family protein [Alphaproteobacteria bacterium]
MAIFHLSARVVKRSGGRSATASAAYRAGEEIADERTGQRFDYTRRHGVVHAEIMAPDNAPAWMHDRAQLWNAVEKVEKRKDAQLAREIELALPHELPPAQRVELVRSFVAAEFVAQGMIADVAIHAPGKRGDQRNAHAHIMLTMRELTGAGFGKKARGWNDNDQLAHWREAWAEHVNSALAREGIDARVDHRSLAAQGIDREPGTHQGPAVAEMTARGEVTDCAATAAAIAERNAARDQLTAELAQLAAQIAALEIEEADQVSATVQARADVAGNDNAMTDDQPTPAPTEQPKAPPETLAPAEPANAAAALSAEKPEAADPRDAPQSRYDHTATTAAPESTTEPDPRARIEAEAPHQAERQADLLAQMERQKLARDAFIEAQRADAEKARADPSQQTTARGGGGGRGGGGHSR